MPLPQKVTEQLARVPARTPGIAGQLLMLTSLLFFVSLGSYLGLQYGYKPYLDTQIENLDKDINNFAKQISPQEQTKIINFYSQLANLETLLNNHIFTSALLDWFEKNTQVNIYYSNFNFDSIKGDITLSGVAKTIEDLGEQLIIFNQLPEVRKVILSGISSQPNGLKEFELRLSINSQLIKRATP